MNKYLSLLLLFSQAIIINQATAQVTSPAHFIKLSPSIVKDAKAWSQSVTSTLSEHLQLTYLNFFALNSEESIPALIKCAEYIESQKEMAPSSKQLGLNIMQKIKKYAERIEEKIAKTPQLTEQEEESLWKKLELKMQELVAYINAIYYETLYNHIYTETASAPLCMFDENGVIPQEKRTKLLPQPE